jgi:hypothetical protein
LIFEQDVDRWDRYHAWILEAVNGTFTPIDPPCVVDRNLDEYDYSAVSWALQRTPITRAWVTTHDGNERRLCSILTEEYSEPLDPSTESAYLLTVTPNGEWAVLMDSDNGAGHWPRYTFYSYNLLSGEFLSLGSFETETFEPAWFDSWLDSTHFVMRASEMPEWSVRWMYIGDVAQPESMAVAATTPRFWPQLILTPPSIEGLITEVWDGPETGPCFVEHYDAQTRTHAYYDLGTLCEYGIPLPDGSGDHLYRALEPSMTLVRYNFRTGVRSALFTGEIEWIGSVSPRGGYAVLGLGDNGAIEMIPDVGPNNSPCVIDVAACLERYVQAYVIVDLNTGELVADFPESSEWFTDDTILVRNSQQLVSMDGREQPLPGIVILPLPDREQLLLQTSDSMVSLYTVATEELTPVVQAVEGLSVTAQEDDTLLITFPRGAEQGSPQVSWVIRLP